MKKFEYRTIKLLAKTDFYVVQDIEDEALVTEMNVLGKEGWELVTSIKSIHEGNSIDFVLIFKREFLEVV